LGVPPKNQKRNQQTVQGVFGFLLSGYRLYSSHLVPRAVGYRLYPSRKTALTKDLLFKLKTLFLQKIQKNNNDYRKRHSRSFWRHHTF
jgi:hypothetical protein